MTQLLQSPAANASAEAQVLAGAALWSIAHEHDSVAKMAAARRPVAEQPPSAWERMDGWRLQGRLVRRLRFAWGPLGSSGARAEIAEVEVHYGGEGYRLRVGSAEGPAALRAVAPDLYALELADQAQQLQILPDGDGQLQIWRDDEHYVLRREDELEKAAAGQPLERALSAPMPGRIIAQSVSVGQSVRKGDPLVTLEAMKMEHTLCAPSDGTVRAVHVAVGDQVQEGMELIELETDSAARAAGVPS